MKKEKQKNQRQKPEADARVLSMSLFTLTAVIYFANAGYSYYKNIEGQVTINIALGVMFFTIGLSFLLTKKAMYIKCK